MVANIDGDRVKVFGRGLHCVHFFKDRFIVCAVASGVQSKTDASLPYVVRVPCASCSDFWFSHGRLLLSLVVHTFDKSAEVFFILFAVHVLFRCSDCVRPVVRVNDRGVYFFSVGVYCAKNPFFHAFPLSGFWFPVVRAFRGRGASTFRRGFRL